MTQERSYQEIFTSLKEWGLKIIEGVKREIKQEHLKKNMGFLKEHFPGKPLQKISSEEIGRVYFDQIQNGENALGEFIAGRWLLKRPEIYHFFESKLVEINPDVTQIQEIQDDQAESLIQAACSEFGAEDTYLFAELSDVKFSPELFKKLRSEAEKEAGQQASSASQDDEQKTVKQLRLELSRVKDRHEKKIQGLQKKYIVDTENLKKQISHLQKKLSTLQAGGA